MVNMSRYKKDLVLPLIRSIYLKCIQENQKLCDHSLYYLFPPVKETTFSIFSIIQNEINESNSCEESHYTAAFYFIIADKRCNSAPVVERNHTDEVFILKADHL